MKIPNIVRRTMSFQSFRVLPKRKPMSLEEPPDIEANLSGRKGGSENDEARSKEMKSPFSPQCASSTKEISGALAPSEGGQQRNNGKPQPPELKLILVALRLAILEKAASGLGVLAFGWATVVLLGGFVTNLHRYDFWVISALLLTEGTRIFSRSHELEWQQAAPRISIKSHAKSIFFLTQFMIFRKASNPDSNNCLNSDPCVPAQMTENSALDGPEGDKRGQISFIPYASFLTAHRVSCLLYSLQLVSALVCVGLSLSRLCNPMHRSAGQANQNRDSAVSIFYVLVLAEALIFLIERAYWEYQITYKKLMVEVNRNCQLGDEQLDNIKRFYYEVYAKCLNGSVLDGLDMDLVSYGMQEVQGNNAKEQLGGALILLQFATRKGFSEETMRRIGTTPGVIERLLEMLTWKEKDEKEVRRVAAQIVCQVACQNSMSFRIVAIAGALESIVSLLSHEGAEPEDAAATLELKLTGLRILKRIARDNQTCTKIGYTGGLLPILLSLIEVRNIMELKQQKEKGLIKVFKKSLQLLKRLATTSGYSGKLLREGIATAVFTLRNLRNILEYAEEYPILQELAVDTLTNLALEDTVRENIGSTGGIIRNLLQLFLRDISGLKRYEIRLCVKAGEALNVLALRSPDNCLRMCKGDGKTLKRIISRLNHQPKIATRAAKILRSLCAFLDKTDTLQIAASTHMVLKAIMEADGKEAEAALGLAAATVPVLERADLDAIFDYGVERKELSKRIMGFLCQSPPSHRLLRLRRYAVELTTALITKDDLLLKEFNSEGLIVQLEEMLDTISDVENFCTFSGEFGLTRHSQTMVELIQLALLKVRTSVETRAS